MARLTGVLIDSHARYYKNLEPNVERESPLVRSEKQIDHKNPRFARKTW